MPHFSLAADVITRPLAKNAPMVNLQIVIYLLAGNNQSVNVKLLFMSDLKIVFDPQSFSSSYFASVYSQKLVNKMFANFSFENKSGLSLFLFSVVFCSRFA